MKANLVDLGFMAARAHLLEVAAFLDRVERAGLEGDFRVGALRRALACLGERGSERARRILEALSDPTLEPSEQAGLPACGAWRGAGEG